MKKILVVGGTGNLGPHLIKEFIHQGHTVSALIRSASFTKPEKVNSLRKLGVSLIEGDIEDAASLKRACQGQQIVVSALGGGQIMQQVPLAKAAREAGVARFIPSEFGLDPITVGPGTCDLFDMKAMAQEQIKATGVATTMIYTNCFMEFWGTGLGKLGALSPPASVQVFGDGDKDAYMVSMIDIARYTCAIICDDSTKNREISIRVNKINQNALIRLWENLSGQKVERIRVSEDDLTEIIDSSTSPETMLQRIFTQLHRSVWINGDCNLSRSELLSAEDLYPQIQAVSLDKYFGSFLKESIQVV